jgi:hypothetical protein
VLSAQEHPPGLGEIERSYSTIAGRCPAMPHVRIGSIASVCPSTDDFRSSPGSVHCHGRSACLKSAKSGRLP